MDLNHRVRRNGFTVRRDRPLCHLPKDTDARDRTGNIPGLGRLRLPLAPRLRAVGGIRTHTSSILSAVPPSFGLQLHIHLEGFEPFTAAGLNRMPLPSWATGADHPGRT